MKSEDISSADIIGAVLYNGKWYIYAATIAYWILDTIKYNPTYNPSDWPYIFRNHLYQIDEYNADLYLIAMNEYELSLHELKKLIHKWGTTEYTIEIVINFDDKIYVNGFHEISVEEYIPATWLGIEDDPMEYVSEEIKQIWKQ